MINSPIIFLIFRRPEETARVFECIRKAQPSKLFIVADGPRNSEEKKLTDAARAVTEKIDWPCEVDRNYSEMNLGCRMRVWSGIDWAMNKLEYDTDGAIILEDDCLPDQSFFTYCSEMLALYKDNEKIMHIGGTCFQDDNPRFTLSIGEYSYYYSRIAQIWGWATWKRAWKLYDGKLDSWPELRENGGLKSALPDLLTYQYWVNHFDKIRANATDTWDIAWTYTCFKERAICIMPKVNLIRNIGTAVGAAHKVNQFSNLPTSPLHFPLIHPHIVEINEEADLFTYKKIYGIEYTFTNKLKAFIKDRLPFLSKHKKRLVK